MRTFDHAGRFLGTLAPIGGTLVAANATSGESTEEGKLHFRVIDMGRVWLSSRVFEPDTPKVKGARSAWFTIEGYEDPLRCPRLPGRGGFNS